jgi:hypothetical protein
MEAAAGSGRTAPRCIAFVGWLLAPAVALLVAAEASRLGLALCPFQRITHLPCPGCGMTRALLALVQGDPCRALAIHPLSPVAAALLCGWWVNNLLLAWGRPRALKVPDRVTRLWWVALVIALALWVARLSGYLGGAP